MALSLSSKDSEMLLRLQDNGCNSGIKTTASIQGHRRWYPKLNSNDLYLSFTTPFLDFSLNVAVLKTVSSLGN